MTAVATFLTDNARVIASAAVVGLSLLLGLLARRALLPSLARLAAETPMAADEVLLESLKRPLPTWFLLGGIFVAIRTVGVPDTWGPALQSMLVVALVVSVTLWAANLVAALLYAGGRSGIASKAPGATGVVRNVARIAVLIVGGLVLLGTLGIPVTPFLTTVGLGGLAVALGLQQTLSNLFAGVQIALEGNIRAGDWVKFESGEQGIVEDIHWRTTRVRTLFGNCVVIPNSRLADSVATNYHLAARGFLIVVEVGVHCASDLDQVERVTCDVARTIMAATPGGVPDFEPFVRYHAFGESSIDLNVILRVQDYRDQFLVKHDFIKALTRRFAAEGIVMPYPTRAIVRGDRVSRS
jgi:small-conductance mechanosensitive channel